MSNAGDIVVRLAVDADNSDFIDMAYKYLVEMRSLGSEVLPTARTLEFWGYLFELYLPHDAHGVVVIAVDTINQSIPVGFSMAGSPTPTSDVDTEFGSIAIGHGTYVRPAYRGRGLSRRLRDALRQQLRDRGFDTIVGGVHLANGGGAASLKGSGFTAYQLLGYERL